MDIGWNEPEDDDEDLFSEMDDCFAVMFPESESSFIPQIIISDGTSEAVLSKTSFTIRDVLQFIQFSPLNIQDLEGVRIIINQKRAMRIEQLAQLLLTGLK